MISIVSVYNNIKILEDMLLKSLKEQSIEYELVLIDNTSGKFSNAATALNIGLKKVKGEIIVIVHQDVEFGKHQLDKLVKYYKKLGDEVIIGAAGRKDSSGVITNIRHGECNSIAGKITLSEPIVVQTLDEVCIVASKKIFDEISFDAETCDDWHLYGADLCLTGIEKGIKSYVVPVELFHKSTGVVNNSYYSSLIKLTRKHRMNFDYIYTSCSKINTNRILSNLYVSTRKTIIFLKKLLK